MSLLSLEHITKRYRDGRGQIAVLDDVSLQVAEGEWVGVWGPRRSGKTTLLQVAGGALQPDEGSVWFDHRNLTEMSVDRRTRLQRRGGIGLLNGDWRPTRNQPVIEHVALPLLSDGMSLREAREPAWRALERVGISDCARLPADRLSVGERLRVGLARILVREPRVILVDEPAILLRPSEAVELYELLRSLAHDSPVATVIASEDLAPLRKARRVVSIGGGRLRMEREPGTLVQFPERQPRHL
jgi:lipoprotein-releasing system ATP-binding protein